MSSSIEILAIAAHPDDVEQTCAGTLIRMAEQGYRTGALDLTAGEMGTRGSREERAAEAAAAARKMLLAERHNLHLPDAKLENTLEARLAIAQKIRDLRPRVVILPYWQARHPDHYRCSQLGYEACFLAGLRKADLEGEPHRPAKIVYASLYADVRPSFVVDISAQQCCPGKVAPTDGKSLPLNVLWSVLPGNDLKSRGRKWPPERSIPTRHNGG